jgi:hypothetical protein
MYVYNIYILMFVKCDALQQSEFDIKTSFCNSNRWPLHIEVDRLRFLVRSLRNDRSLIDFRVSNSYIYIPV